MPVKNVYYEEYLEKIPDISDKVVAITGTTSGTGYWAAVFAVRKGVKALVLLNRESQRSKDALEQLQAEKEKAGVSTELHAVACNLQSFDSVREAAPKVNEIVKPLGGLNVLFNNAGVGTNPDRRTGDGYDVAMHTNYLSHYLLTKLVFPSFQEALNNGKEVRICQYSSGARHMDSEPISEKYFVKSKPGTLGRDRPLAAMRRYHQSKLACATFALKLDKMLKEKGFDTTKIKSVVGEPGAAATSLMKNAGSEGGFIFRSLQRFSFALFQWLTPHQSAADGSLPGVQACFGEDVNGGDFFMPEKRSSGKPIKIISEGSLTPLGSAKEEKLCLDEQNQDNVWKFSETHFGKFFE